MLNCLLYLGTFANECKSLFERVKPRLQVSRLPYLLGTFADAEFDRNTV
jgi:hypothetical protein